MKLVYIEWLDHSSFTENTWRTKEEYDEGYGPQLCKTIGWVLKEEKDHYVIVSTVNEQEDNEDKYLADMCILKGTIKSFKEVKLT